MDEDAMALTKRFLAFIVVSLIFLIFPVTGDGVYSCPLGCRCTILRRQNSERTTLAPAAIGESLVSGSAPGRKVVCQDGTPKIRSVLQIPLENLPRDTFYLDLSGNDIEELRQDSFLSLSTLQRLNLSSNPVAVVEPGAFNGLASLERLDLSGTKLTTINASILTGMPRLQRLVLLNSNIMSLQAGSFEVLPALARLDLQTTVLVCDCHIDWFVEWLKSSEVRVNNSTICSLPTPLRGIPLKTLRHDDLHCDWPLELPLFELQPSSNQIVFEGDKLPLECHVTQSDAEMNVTWVHKVFGENTSDEYIVQSDSDHGIIVHARLLPDRTLITTLVIEQIVSSRDAGNWTCRVATAIGTSEQSVAVTVLSRDMVHCPLSTTSSDRGRYVWPRTIAGVEHELPCAAGPAHGIAENAARATARRLCDNTGHWCDVDVTRCRFSSNTTQMLENYLTDLGSNKTRPSLLAEQLRHKFGHGHVVSEKIDVIYWSRIVEALSRSVGSSDKLADIVIEFVSMLMNTPANVLISAHHEDRACSRLVSSLEDMTEQLLQNRDSVRLMARNVAIQAHKVEPRGFVGINCTAYSAGGSEAVSGGVDHRSLVDESSVYCTDLKDESMESVEHNSSSSSSSSVNSVYKPDASIRILADFLKVANCVLPFCSHTDAYRMMFVVFKNSKLFPLVNENSSLAGQQVSPLIISGKIFGVSTDDSNINSSSLLTVQFSLSDVAAHKIRTPAYWHSSAANGFGRWLTEGCVMENTGDASLVTFHCRRLSSFALILNDPPLSTTLQSLLASWCKLGIIIYASSLFLAICLLIVIVTYAVFHRRIQMSAKSRHAVVNMCVAALLLCGVFTLGVKLTQSVVVCRVVGISIHYLSLSTLLWITVIVYKMYNKLAKLHRPRPSPEEMLGEPPKPKPILTGYLLGWGVAIIICGISGAINWTNYAQEQFCFLMLEAAFLTCFIPAGVLLAINVLLVLRIFCLLRVGSAQQQHPSSLSANPGEDPDTEETHDNNEIEVLAPTPPVQRRVAHGDDTMVRSVHSNSPSFGVEQTLNELDAAYSPSRQLIALVILLFIFCFAWTMGALVVVLPFHFPHSGIVFQCLYALAVAAFGLFCVAHYCAGRAEVRASCCRRSQLLHATHSVESNRWRYVKTVNSNTSNSAGGAAAGGTTKPTENGSIAHGSHVAEGSVVSVGPERISLAARSLRSDTDRSAKLMASSTIVPLDSCAASPDPAALDCTAFYNPRQNGVARKYWDRVRKKRALGCMRDNEVRDVEEVQTHDVGRSGLPNGGNPEKLSGKPNGINTTVVTASVENHRCARMPDDEEQPLLPILTPIASTKSAHACMADNNVTSRPDFGSTKPPDQITRYGALPAPFIDTGSGPKEGSMPGSSSLHEAKIPVEFLEQLELRIPPRADNESVPVSVANHVDEGSSRKLDSINGSSRSLPRQRRNVSSTGSDDLPPPTTPAAYAFINKNYARNTDSLRSSSRPSCNGTLDKKQPEPTLANSLPSSGTGDECDVWLPQNIQHSKVKTETSV